MKRFFSWWKHEESGQGMVEYALVIMLIAMAAVGVLSQIADPLNTIFNKAADGLS